jgi:hypothetical protein
MADAIHRDALRMTKKESVSSPRALWWIRIRHKAPRVTNTSILSELQEGGGGPGPGRELAGEGAGGERRSCGGFAAAA